MFRLRTTAVAAALALVASILAAPAASAAGQRATAHPAAIASQAAAPADRTSSQIITVSATSSTATTATLTAWQKNSVGQWKAVIGPLSAWVGEQGIGQASEGLGKTPQGTWTLPQAFGRQTDPGTALPYFQTDPMDWWNGDVNSPQYNTHVRQANNPGGASENLYYSGAVYDYAALIGYNLARVPGAGSAFFLHVSGGEPTAGCVSVPAASLVSILKWVKPSSKPMIRIGVNVGKPQDDPLADGDFVRSTANNQVYRITGGAPVRVTSWSTLGLKTQPTRMLSAAQINGMRDYPRDGTFVRVRSSGNVYKILGGAPLPVTTWAGFGGQQRTIGIDPAAITNAGKGPGWNNLRQYPLDGTAIRVVGSNNLYRIAGGAPIHVSNKKNLSSKVGYYAVDPQAVVHAGGTGWWSHLRQVPKAGTFIIGWTTNKVYRVSASGVPKRITSWAPYGGVQPNTFVDQVAIDRHGDGGVWSHLN